MVREEAIKVLERAEDYVGIHYINGVEDPYINPYLQKAIDFVVSELREQEERENRKPLTLDELRQMDGEPVWVSVSQNWRESGVSEGWCIVRFHSVDDRVRVYIYDTRHGARFFAQQDYGISWLAYRQKPKGE